MSVMRPHHWDAAVVAVDSAGEREALVVPSREGRYVERMVLVRSRSASTCADTWRNGTLVLGGAHG